MKVLARLFLATVWMLSGSSHAQEATPLTRDDPNTTTDPKGSGVQFTRPDGTVVFVNPRAVAYVRAPLSGEHGHAVIVFTSGHTQQVMETVEQVIHGIHIDMPNRGEQ